MTVIEHSYIQQIDNISLDQKMWFSHWIKDDSYPCVMAKAVVKSENMIVNDYLTTTNAMMLQKLSSDLKDFIAESNQLDKNKFVSFVAVFSQEKPVDEVTFERLLWNLLFQLRKIDPEQWDPAVSDNPEDNNYSYSHQGTAFYIIGMHSNSNRKARQTPYFTIVFNRHSQFEDLRDMGAYDSVRTRIRNRDKEYSGSVNPMLADFGEGSVAVQYSGRNIHDGKGQCPFLKKTLDKPNP